MRTKTKNKNRFNIDFFEFSFLVEACIPPRPIARSLFWQDVINKYYNVLTQDERDRLYEWINRNPCMVSSLNQQNEDCLWFNARFDKENQYLITTNFNNKEEVIETFLFKGNYYTAINKYVSPEYIIKIEEKNGSKQKSN